MSAIVDIYCRTATSGPMESPELEAQEAACRAYCEAHGLSVGRVYHEIASGVSYRERKHLNLMRRRYRNGVILGIVAADINRLSRCQVHLVILMEEMEQHGATLHCVNGELEDTAINRLTRSILAFVREVEREKALDTLPTSSEL